MIFDTLDRHDYYPFGEAWAAAFAFLRTLSPESAEGRYPIDGENIFAIVMSYPTDWPEGKLFESHREYVDIQSVLVGSEGFECERTELLGVTTPYDSTKDAAFYRREHAGAIRVDVTPGTFVMLYPHDAHLAGLVTGSVSEPVKKVVVKVRRSLLRTN